MLALDRLILEQRRRNLVQGVALSDDDRLGALMLLRDDAMDFRINLPRGLFGNRLRAGDVTPEENRVVIVAE